MAKVDRVSKPLKKTATKRGKGAADLKTEDGVTDFTPQARRRRARAEARAADKPTRKPAPAPKIERARDTRADLNKQIAEGFNRKAKKLRQADDTPPKLTLKDIGIDPDAVEGENAAEVNADDEQAKAREERRKATKALLERLGGDAE